MIRVHDPALAELQRWRWVAIAPLLGLAVAYTAVVAAAEHVGGLDDEGDH